MCAWIGIVTMCACAVAAGASYAVLLDAGHAPLSAYLWSFSGECGVPALGWRECSGSPPALTIAAAAATVVVARRRLAVGTCFAVALLATTPAILRSKHELAYVFVPPLAVGANDVIEALPFLFGLDQFVDEQPANGSTEGSCDVGPPSVARRMGYVLVGDEAHRKVRVPCLPVAFGASCADLEGALQQYVVEVHDASCNSNGSDQAPTPSPTRQ